MEPRRKREEKKKETAQAAGKGEAALLENRTSFEEKGGEGKKGRFIIKFLILDGESHLRKRKKVGGKERRKGGPEPGARGGRGEKKGKASSQDKKENVLIIKKERNDRKLRAAKKNINYRQKERRDV